MQKVSYGQLNARQKESYNFQKVSAVLADYGFTTLRLSDDWQGADFIAQHANGVTFLKIQMKGRAYFDKKYEGKGIYICFRDEAHWYLYPHDEILAPVLKIANIERTYSDLGYYSFPKLTARLRELFGPFHLESSGLAKLLIS